MPQQRMLSILERPRKPRFLNGNSRWSCFVELPCPTKDDEQMESGQKQTIPDQDKPASHQNDVTPAKELKKQKRQAEDSGR